MRALVLVGAAFCVSVAGAASAGHEKQVLPPFEATTQCMLGVLKSEPHIKNPTLVGHDWGRSPIPADNYGTDTRPYIEYVFEDAKGGAATVRFRRADEHGPLWFQAGLPGIFTPGMSGPPDYGTAHIEARWNNECHVAAVVLYN